MTHAIHHTKRIEAGFLGGPPGPTAPQNPQLFRARDYVPDRYPVRLVRLDRFTPKIRAHFCRSSGSGDSMKPDRLFLSVLLLAVLLVVGGVL